MKLFRSMRDTANSLKFDKKKENTKNMYHIQTQPREMGTLPRYTIGIQIQYTIYR